MKMISYISICTLSDLGVLSDLIGSLSRTTLQYSTPSECRNAQARCFVEFLNKIGRNHRVDVFDGKKTAFFHLL